MASQDECCALKYSTSHRERDDSMDSLSCIHQESPLVGIDSNGNNWGKGPQVKATAHAKAPGPHWVGETCGTQRKARRGRNGRFMQVGDASSGSSRP